MSIIVPHGGDKQAGGNINVKLRRVVRAGNVNQLQKHVINT